MYKGTSPSRCVSCHEWHTSRATYCDDCLDRAAKERDQIVVEAERTARRRKAEQNAFDILNKLF